MSMLKSAPRPSPAAGPLPRHAVVAVLTGGGRDPATVRAGASLAERARRPLLLAVPLPAAPFQALGALGDRHPDQDRVDHTVRRALPRPRRHRPVHHVVVAPYRLPTNAVPGDEARRAADAVVDVTRRLVAQHVVVASELGPDQR